MNFSRFLPDPIPKKKPIIFEVADAFAMLTTDVVTEGKKSGYERAAREYETVYRELEKEYKVAIKCIREQQNSYHNESEEYLVKLSSLEKERDRLKKKKANSMRQTAKKLGVPISTVKSAFGGTSPFSDYGPSIFGLIADHRKKKMREAEKEGYAEARALYEGKLRKLSKKLNKHKEDGTKKINDYINHIEIILGEIGKTQMEIADLEILMLVD